MADKILGYAVVSSRLPVNLTQQQNAIDHYHERYLALHDQRQNIRNLSLMFMVLITLFVLFVATWIARILANADQRARSPRCCEAAGEVRRGNLQHRVHGARRWTNWRCWCAASTR